MTRISLNRETGEAGEYHESDCKAQVDMIRIKAGGARIRSSHYSLLSGQLLTDHQADLDGSYGSS